MGSFCVSMLMGDIISSLLGFDVEPLPYRDPEFLQPEINDASLCNSRSLYQEISNPYIQAALISTEKAKVEREGAKIDSLELQQIIQRTSIHSLLQERKNPLPTLIESELNEDSSFSIEMDSENLIPPCYTETYKYHFVNPKDTLEGIALQYCIKVAELRRLNNMNNNQEIYARETIRVPNLIPIKAEDKQQKLTLEQEKILTQFCTITKCAEPSIAMKYLRKYGFKVKPASQKYQLDAAKSKLA